MYRRDNNDLCLCVLMSTFRVVDWDNFIFHLRNRTFYWCRLVWVIMRNNSNTCGSKWVILMYGVMSLEDGVAEDVYWTIKRRNFPSANWSVLGFTRIENIVKWWNSDPVISQQEINWRKVVVTLWCDKSIDDLIFYFRHCFENLGDQVTEVHLWDHNQTYSGI